MTTPTGFRRASDGVPTLEVDPAADKDYSVCWADYLNGDLITSSDWTIDPAVATVPHTKSINGSPVTIDGVTYAAGTVTTAWVKNLQSGVEYIVTNRIVTAGGRTDDRSFRLIGKDL